jgi:2-dehydropantoate 2-reductase
MRILVVGAGAVGGYFGVRLAQAGRDVSFLVRPRRAALLRESGLIVDSADGARTGIAPQLVTADEFRPGWDLVLLSVKAYGLESAIADLAPGVDERTAVLPALNGLRHIDVLVEAFGTRAVLGGVSYISAHLSDDGRVEVGPLPPAITYGELDGGRGRRIDDVHEALQVDGFAARLSTDIWTDLWEKWVFLSAGGVFNTLLRGTVGEGMAAPGGAETARAVLAESSAVAAAAGHPARPEALARFGALLTDAGSGFTTSLYKDLVTGRALESEQIVGDLVDRADALGVPVPLFRAARAALAVARP